MALLRDPHMTPTAAMGWWAWWDQGLYQRAAVAWAHGVTDPVFHWYLPGYPLLGAMFVHLTPADPFMLPDLACLIGTLWLFCGIVSCLLDISPPPLRVPMACCLFVASTVLPFRTLWSWVVPWTTTPETLAIYGTLFGAIRLIERAERRDAFLIGFASVAIAGFRPADAAVVVLFVAVVTVPVLFSRRPRRLSLPAAALCGALTPLVVLGGAYLVVWGPRLSGYLVLSNQIGFEPRLLALRWVTLMIDPRPLYPDGHGFAAVFFWILPGIVGMAATLVVVRSALRPAHLLIVGTVAADVILFLIYRDLHPTGLWQFGNYHYFKWTLPLFAVYALRLVMIALKRERRRPAAIAVGCLTVPLLFFWRADLSRIEPLPPAADASTVTLMSGLSPIDMMVLVPGHGVDGATTIEGSATTSSEAQLRSGFDFVIYNAGDMLRIAPLRRLPAAPTTIRFAAGTVAGRDSPPVLIRQTIRWGLPYWLAGQ